MVVIPIPSAEAPSSIPVKLCLSVAPTLGRSSVNSITRVVPENVRRLRRARRSPTRSPSSIAVDPPTAIVSIVARMSARPLALTLVGGSTTSPRSPVGHDRDLVVVVQLARHGAEALAHQREHLGHRARLVDDRDEVERLADEPLSAKLGRKPELPDPAHFGLSDQPRLGGLAARADQHPALAGLAQRQVVLGKQPLRGKHVGVRDFAVGDAIAEVSDVLRPTDGQLPGERVVHEVVDRDVAGRGRQLVLIVAGTCARRGGEEERKPHDEEGPGAHARSLAGTLAIRDYCSVITWRSPGQHCPQA